MNVAEIKTVGDFVRRKIEMLDKESSKSQAMCAKLRRSIGKPPGATPDIWEVTIQGTPESWRSRNDEPSFAEWAVHTALPLYALHKQGKSESMHNYEVSFASAVARLVKLDDNRQDAIRRRFNAVATSANFTELSYHARD